MTGSATMRIPRSAFRSRATIVARIGSRKLFQRASSALM